MLYLVRHGEARTDGPDNDRTLTEHGVAGVERVAEWIARTGATVNEIRHSGKRRAEQTASILAARLNAASVVAIAGIAPNDDPVAFAQSIADDESVMIVSHLPFLAYVVATLLGTERAIVDFHPATVVALQRVQGGFVIDFVVHPRMG
jgi:phosphohistidine phosphatase